ncbi:MAG: tagaturonate epimerase family protein [Nitrososphaerales archaeon]
MVIKTYYLGKIRHPAIGIRIPEIFLTGILRAYKKRNVAGGLMLSFGRETAPQKVIDSPPNSYEITLGHTGTSIRKYMTLGAEAAQNEGVFVEIEADHIMVIGSSTRAVKRLAGIHEEGAEISDEELERSMEYNKMAIDEALSTGYVNSFTTDTSDLLDLTVDSLSEQKLKEKFNRSVPDANELLKRHMGEFSFYGTKRFTCRLMEKDVMRLALKYGKSIAANAQIYDYIKERIDRPFGFEISLDETKEKTREKDLIFYLREWKFLGRNVDFVAPNIGFKKRTDFHGDLNELYKHVARLATIAKSFGALLSIHSGSGTTPYSSKGKGTYGALLKATEGRLKYKISGVYYELLLQILASFPKGSKERKLYDLIFDSVYDFLMQEVKRKGKLASPLLEKQLLSYKYQVKDGKIEKRDPRAKFFRFNSYLALNLRNKRGVRHLRDGLVEVYEKRPELRKIVDQEVEKLTIRLIDGLHFNNNVLEMDQSCFSSSNS